MIRTDGRPTIAWSKKPLPEPITDGRDPGDEHVPGQLTVEEALAEWEREQREAEPIYGGF